MTQLNVLLVKQLAASFAQGQGSRAGVGNAVWAGCCGCGWSLGASGVLILAAAGQSVAHTRHAPQTRSRFGRSGGRRRESGCCVAAPRTADGQALCRLGSRGQQRARKRWPGSHIACICRPPLLVASLGVAHFHALPSYWPARTVPRSPSSTMPKACMLLHAPGLALTAPRSRAPTTTR
jgi:hypothetical protein